MGYFLGGLLNLIVFGGLIGSLVGRLSKNQKEQKNQLPPSRRPGLPVQSAMPKPRRPIHQMPQHHQDSRAQQPARPVSRGRLSTDGQTARPVNQQKSRAGKQGIGQQTRINQVQKINRPATKNTYSYDQVDDDRSYSYAKLDDDRSYSYAKVDDDQSYSYDQLDDNLFYDYNQKKITGYQLKAGKNLRRSIIMAEVLGKPLGLREDGVSEGRQY